MEFKRVVFRSLKARNTAGLNELVGNLAFRMKVGAEWLFLGRGLMSTPLASAHAIIRSRPAAPLPDLKLQLHHFSGKDRMRSVVRREGKECVSTFRSRWSPYH